jgi:hypothetical protein
MIGMRMGTRLPGSRGCGELRLFWLHFVFLFSVPDEPGFGCDSVLDLCVCWGMIAKGFLKECA